MKINYIWKSEFKGFCSIVEGNFVRKKILILSTVKFHFRPEFFKLWATDHLNQNHLLYFKKNFHYNQKVNFYMTKLYQYGYLFVENSKI